MKVAIKYQLNGLKKPILIYYALVIGIMLVGIILNAVLNDGNVSGTNQASFIFLFVIGIVIFREGFYFFQQNGVSRKTQINSFAITALIVSCFIALFDVGLFELLNGLMSDRINFFEEIYYSLEVAETPNFLMIIYMFIWQFALNLIAIFIGYFISLAYFRMAKWMRIIVSIGVPVLIISTLSTLPVSIDLTGALSKIYTFVFGINNFMQGIASFIMISVILFLINKLLIRRAVIK